LLDEKLRDVADTAIHDNVAAESVDGSAGVSASRSAPAGASNDNVSAKSMDTSPTSTVTAVPLDPTLVVTARTAHAGDFYEATVVKGASGLLLGVGPVAASSSSSFTGGDNDKEEGEEVATGLCITRFREPPVEQDNSGVHASADSTAAVLPFRHPLEEQGVLLGDIIAAFSRKRHASETSPTSDEEGGEEDDEEEGGKEKWLHVEQWPYEDVRAKLLSMPLGQQSVLFRRSQFASVPGENGSGIAATGMEAPPPPMTLASAQRDAAAAGTAMSQLLQLTRLPPLPSGVAGRWVDDHNPLHKHRAATRASNAVATVRAGTLSTGSGGSGSGGAGGSGLEQGFVAKRREGAFRAVGATDDTPGTSSDLVPMHTSGPSTRADSAMPASGNAGAGSAAAATPTAAATAAVDLIETKGRRARPGFTSCSGTSIASAATIKSHARALDLAQGEEMEKKRLQIGRVREMIDKERRELLFFTLNNLLHHSHISFECALFVSYFTFSYYLPLNGELTYIRDWRRQRQCSDCGGFLCCGRFSGESRRGKCVCDDAAVGGACIRAVMYSVFQISNSYS